MARRKSSKQKGSNKRRNLGTSGEQKNNGKNKNREASFILLSFLNCLKVKVNITTLLDMDENEVFKTIINGRDSKVEELLNIHSNVHRFYNYKTALSPYMSQKNGFKSFSFLTMVLFSISGKLTGPTSLLTIVTLNKQIISMINATIIKTA